MTQTTSGTSRRLANASYFFVSVTVLGAPWLFGAWERWWFWPFAALIFLSAACFGARLLLAARGADELYCPPAANGEAPRMRPDFALLLCFVPFLCYALVRALQADVAMDAERSFLLFLTPLLLAIQIVYGLTREQRHTLFALIIADLVLLGLYGVMNHYATGDRLVLWADGFPQYVHGCRATGSYFCPDHFAGIMEFAFAIGLACAMSRQTSWSARWGYLALMALALLGIGLSKSRGGGIVVVALLVAAVVWGFSMWPRERALWHRISSVAAIAIVLIMVWNHDNSYVERFKAYFPKHEQHPSVRERAATLYGHLLRTSRGRMIGGALRAWKSAPVLGIGPGMHRHRWPEFAATQDGDRSEGVRPTLTNHTFHSYEVHSDWVQLLEEYGIAGFILFLVPAIGVYATLRKGIRNESARWRERRIRMPRESDHAVMFSGLLVLISMGVHSLGDFNLQMPATTWLFGAILALAVTAAWDQPGRSRRTAA